MYVITIIVIIKRHVLFTVNYRRAVKEPTRVEKLYRKRNPIDKKVSHLTLIRDSKA